MGDPFGYQIPQLYGRNNKVTTLRTKTHAEMTADSLRNSGNPKFYVVDVDEANGNAQDVLYWWDGIVLSPLKMESANVTVATYDLAVPLFTGPSFKRINVLSDTAYNDGDKSFYTYDPDLGVAFMGLDYKYTE